MATEARLSQRMGQYRRLPGLSWVALPRQLCSGGRRGQPSSVPTPGPVGDQGFRGPPERHRQPVCPFPKSRPNSALVSRKVTKTAQWAGSGGPSSFQKCPHHVEYSKFYQREQTEVTKTPPGLCQTSAPRTIPLFSHRLWDNLKRRPQILNVDRQVSRHIWFWLCGSRGRGIRGVGRSREPSLCKLPRWYWGTAPAPRLPDLTNENTGRPAKWDSQTSTMSAF